MTTRVTEGVTVSRLRCSCARALRALNYSEEKERLFAVYNYD